MRQLTPKTANTMDVQRSEMVEANDDREFGCRSNQVVEEKKTKFTRETAILEHSLVQFWNCRCLRGNLLFNGQTYRTVFNEDLFSFRVPGQCDGVDTPQTCCTEITRHHHRRTKVNKNSVILWKFLAQGSNKSKTIRETTINQHEAIHTSKYRIHTSHLEIYEHPGWYQRLTFRWMNPKPMALRKARVGIQGKHLGYTGE